VRISPPIGAGAAFWTRPPPRRQTETAGCLWGPPIAPPLAPPTPPDTLRREKRHASGAPPRQRYSVAPRSAAPHSTPHQLLLLLRLPIQETWDNNNTPLNKEGCCPRHPGEICTVPRPNTL